MSPPTRSRALLFLPLLAGCWAPPVAPCRREPVVERGQVARLVIDSANPAPPLGLPGAPLSVTAFAPLSACSADSNRLTVRVELVGPDNFVVSDALITEPRLVRAVPEVDGHPPVEVDMVAVDVTFTPSLPGQYLMHVIFEPMLGVRTLLLDVGEPRLDPPSVRVRVPSWAECVDQPWPLGAEVVACERSTRRVELHSADGGLSSFDGEQLVVAGPVLWSVEAATNELQRRVFVDGGLVLTDAFAGFGTRTVPGMHDERSALRVRTSGELTLVRVESPLSPVPSPANSEALLYLDGQEVLAESACDTERCFGLQGLEPEMAWTVENLGVGVVGFKRPFQSVRVIPDAVLRRPWHRPQIPARGFERLPLWLPVEGTGLSALVNADRQPLAFTVWNRAEVLRVGKHFVLLKDPQLGDELRVTPR